ncbi:hypothetical protein VitviT2T_020433 [Vitis vinifera]|uniref:Dirigent protein n=2 Tax=Vitis vinifera TaxID=29760 RepID=A5C7K2_VITVI|eukprot:XP_002266452.2 PREDICTED: dirigent protein 22 [Vitis vinifera]
MASFLTYTTLFSLFSTFSITIPAAFSQQFAEEIATMRLEKVSHLHFYFHDILSGKNPTATQIAGPKKGHFGVTMMVDDALTEGPEPSSKLLGRAQGLYALSAQQEPALLMVMNFAFMEGKYNGSSISVLGRNPVMHAVREMPIVGGSGLFRYARGYALAHTVWFDGKTGDAIVEYNVSVLHF